MTCPNCGAANPDTGRFCRLCGVRLLAEEATPEARVSASSGITFARDAVLALALPVPFLVPLPLFWRHAEVPRRVRFAVACAGVLWAVCVGV